MLVAKLEGTFSIPILARIKDASTNDIVAEIEDHVHFRRINVAICPPWFIRNWT